MTEYQGLYMTLCPVIALCCFYFEVVIVFEALYSLPFWGYHLWLVYVFGVVSMVSSLVCFFRIISSFLVVNYSHLKPSQPVGCYLKHGFEVASLFPAIVVLLRKEHLSLPLLATSSFIVDFHLHLQLMYHPADLGFSDWLFDEAMQVVLLYGCGESMYAFAAAVVTFVAIIYYRFRYYLPPKEASHLPFAYGYHIQHGPDHAC